MTNRSVGPAQINHFAGGAGVKSAIRMPFIRGYWSFGHRTDQEEWGQFLPVLRTTGWRRLLCPTGRDWGTPGALVFLLVLAFASNLLANPQGMSVAAGSATASANGSTLNI